MRYVLIVVSVASLVVACSGLDLGTDHGKTSTSNGGPSADASPDPDQPVSCKEGAPHVGFANTDLVAGRGAGGIGIDRRRVKPYSALASEFQRALGKVPEELVANEAAFGVVPPRWYNEPTAGAVSLYTIYTLAFTTCYDTMVDVKYTQMPTVDSATVECAAMQRKIWQRSPTPDETKACADNTAGATDETDARRRWAHACASIMASAGFTTY